MGTTNLGRVVPINKGEYSASETYEQNHIVRFGTATYWHYGLQPTTGVAPTDTTVWCLVAQDGEAGATWDAIANKPFETIGVGLNVDEDGALKAYIVKSTMDSVSVAGAQYYLGAQSAVSITLPSSAEVGQQISVVFYSGETATTLSVDGYIIGDVPTPDTNQRVEVNLLWDGSYWAIVSNVLAVPEEETV